jgi:hypothetical protein
MSKTVYDEWECRYCGGEKPDGHNYCSESCENHAAAEAKLRGLTNPRSPADCIRPPADSPRWPGVRADANDVVLPTDSEERKQIPLFSGVLNYFPLALAAVARVSKRGNDKHNPGQAIHWARGKSMDHADCIARHLLDIETINAQGEYEDAMALAWRALAKLQEFEEQRLNKPMSRGSKVT